MSVGRLLGVRIRLNPYFLALLALLALGGLLWETLILFGIVFVHEMAHVITAKAAGLTVREVELLPFGGVARIEDLVEFDPAIEIGVAIAGPLTNAVMYGIGVAVAAYASPPETYLSIFLWGNISIGAFNLVPALPLDGGRIVRALLARRIGFRRATDRAARLGKVCAVVMAVAGGYGVSTGYVSVAALALPAFVYLAAGKEEKLAAYVFVRYLTRKQRELSRSRCLVAHHLVALEETSLNEVMRSFVPQRFHIVWVLDAQGKVKGVATEIEVIEAGFRLGIEVPIAEAIKPS